jgi:hypothetical protein
MRGPSNLFSVSSGLMTQLFRLLSLALLASFLVVSPATAQTEGVGVGASLGVTNGSAAFDRNPIGLNLKAWLSDRQALSGMTSFFISGTNPASQSYWILQGDYLFHNFNKLDVGEGLLALYVGAGGQYTVFEDRSNQFALRSPLGVNYLLGSAPIDVFVEVAPTLRVTDPSALRFDGAIGFRYYFTAGSGPSE